MLAKEAVGGRGGVSESQKAKAVDGSQTKGWEMKARKTIMLGKLISVAASSLLNVNVRTREV